MSKLVYFLRPVGQIGPIKIGCSKFCETRLENYIRWSPTPLEIIAAVPGSHADERTLHGMFAKHWLHHEWFGASKELLKLLDYVQAEGRLPDLPKVLPFKLPRRESVRSGHSPVPRAPRGPSKKKLEFAALIAPAYLAGATGEQIAEQHDCSTGRVYQALRVAGIVRPRGAPKGRCGPENKDRAEDFRRRYLAGETLQQIGDAWGVTRERVRQILRKTDVESLGHRPRPPRALTDVERAIVAAYDNGDAPRDIIEQFSTNYSALYSLLRKAGVAIKPRGTFQRLPDDAEITAQVAAMYLAGSSPAEIVSAVPHLKHSETVYRYLAKAGVRACRRGGHRRGQLEAKAAQIIADRQAGMIISAIAKKHGAAPAAVDKVLDRHGVKLSRQEAARLRRAA